MWFNIDQCHTNILTLRHETKTEEWTVILLWWLLRDMDWLVSVLFLRTHDVTSAVWVGAAYCEEVPAPCVLSRHLDSLWRSSSPAIALPASCTHGRMQWMTHSDSVVWGIHTYPEYMTCTRADKYILDSNKRF